MYNPAREAAFSSYPDGITRNGVYHSGNRHDAHQSKHLKEFLA